MELLTKIRRVTLVTLTALGLIGPLSVQGQAPASTQLVFNSETNSVIVNVNHPAPDGVSYTTIPDDSRLTTETLFLINNSYTSSTASNSEVIPGNPNYSVHTPAAVQVNLILEGSFTPENGKVELLGTSSYTVNLFSLDDFSDFLLAQCDGPESTPGIETVDNFNVINIQKPCKGVSESNNIFTSELPTNNGILLNNSVTPTAVEGLPALDGNPLLASESVSRIYLDFEQESALVLRGTLAVVGEPAEVVINCPADITVGDLNLVNITRLTLIGSDYAQLVTDGDNFDYDYNQLTGNVTFSHTGTLNWQDTSVHLYAKYTHFPGQPTLETQKTLNARELYSVSQEGFAQGRYSVVKTLGNLMCSTIDHYFANQGHLDSEDGTLAIASPGIVNYNEHFNLTNIARYSQPTYPSYKAMMDAIPWNPSINAVDKELMLNFTATITAKTLYLNAFNANLDNFSGAQIIKKDNPGEQRYSSKLIAKGDINNISTFNLAYIPGDIKFAEPKDISQQSAIRSNDSLSVEAEGVIHNHGSILAGSPLNVYGGQGIDPKTLNYTHYRWNQRAYSNDHNALVSDAKHKTHSCSYMTHMGVKCPINHYIPPCTTAGHKWEHTSHMKPPQSDFQYQVDQFIVNDSLGAAQVLNVRHLGNDQSKLYRRVDWSPFSSQAEYLQNMQNLLPICAERHDTQTFDGTINFGMGYNQMTVGGGVTNWTDQMYLIPGHLKAVFLNDASLVGAGQRLPASHAQARLASMLEEAIAFQAKLETQRLKQLPEGSSATEIENALATVPTVNQLARTFGSHLRFPDGSVYISGYHYAHEGWDLSFEQGSMELSGTALASGQNIAIEIQQANLILDAYQASFIAYEDRGRDHYVRIEDGFQVPSALVSYNPTGEISITGEGVLMLSGSQLLAQRVRLSIDQVRAYIKALDLYDYSWEQKRKRKYFGLMKTTAMRETHHHHQKALPYVISGYLDEEKGQLILEGVKELEATAGVLNSQMYMLVPLEEVRLKEFQLVESWAVNSKVKSSGILSGWLGGSSHRFESTPFPLINDALGLKEIGKASFTNVAPAVKGLTDAYSLVHQAAHIKTMGDLFTAMLPQLAVGYVESKSHDMVTHTRSIPVYFDADEVHIQARNIDIQGLSGRIGELTIDHLGGELNIRPGVEETWEEHHQEHHEIGFNLGFSGFTVYHDQSSSDLKVYHKQHIPSGVSITALTLIGAGDAVITDFINPETMTLDYDGTILVTTEENEYLIDGESFQTSQSVFVDWGFTHAKPSFSYALSDTDGSGNLALFAPGVIAERAEGKVSQLTLRDGLFWSNEGMLSIDEMVLGDERTLRQVVETQSGGVNINLPTMGSTGKTASSWEDTAMGRGIGLLGMASAGLESQVTEQVMRPTANCATLDIAGGCPEGLNQDLDRALEVTLDDQTTYSIAIPVFDGNALSQSWQDIKGAFGGIESPINTGDSTFDELLASLPEAEADYFNYQEQTVWVDADRFKAFAEEHPEELDINNILLPGDGQKVPITRIACSTNYDITDEEALNSLHIPEEVHTALDLAGLVPIIGEVADGTNAVLYAVEGDWVNSGLSAASMVPIAGYVGTGTKLTIKHGADVVQQSNRQLARMAKKTVKDPEFGLKWSGLTNMQKGILGENTAFEALFRSGYVKLDSKLPSNHGIDGVFAKFTKSGQVDDLIVVEAKASVKGETKLGKSIDPKTGNKDLVQMSPDWIEKKIAEMKDSPDIGVQKTAELLKEKFDTARRKIAVLSPDGQVRWGSSNTHLPGEKMTGEINWKQEL